ncbi:hypothetical protein JXA02_03395, partial [candidate division KSB1 bacterium]|nr:hypothetical protein [candidate division KSB1 bacterium]
FLRFYNLEMDDLRDHWSSDEDQDWNDGDDKNNNGIYDTDENPGDDVGLDGIGPGELNYDGPDEGECNHRPDFIEGLGCEPNYNATDVTESDMLGLSAFSLFHVQEQLNGQPKTFHADWVMWQLTGTGLLKEFIGEISNLIEVFASGPFPLYKGRTERVSMSILHSYDQLSDLSQQPPRAPVLFELKKVVQLIYEKDYRFAQPPKMPTLTATAYDAKVVLTWDDVADKASREPFLGGINDFEGYKLIRATDKKFQDAQVVTDGFGTPAMYKPIYQCDIKDGKRGFTNFGLLNGMGYYLGDDTGLTHYFVDENVQNGMTYYYGIVAYDYGIDEETAPPGIAPSENNLVIELDEYEQIRHIGKNVQIVTPRAVAPGYSPHSLEILASSIKNTSGSVTAEIFAKNTLKNNHIYTFKFDADTLSLLKNTTNHPYYYLTNGYTIYDVSDSQRVVTYERPGESILDNLVYDQINFDETAPQKEWFMKIGSPMKSDAADGVVMTLQANHITSIHGGYDYINSGWAQGVAEIDILPTVDAIKYFPWDYELIFTNDPDAYIGKINGGAIRDDSVKIEPEQQLINLAWPCLMINKTFPTTDGEYDTLDIVGVDDNLNGVFDWTEDRLLFCAIDPGSYRWKKTVFVIKFGSQPQAGDVYFLTFNRPHFSTDSLTFRIVPEGELNAAALNAGMEDIKVVPNPYIATNDMEPVVSNWYLNQRRSIMFTHLPAECTITIFTISGVFVDELLVRNEGDNGVAHWDVKTAEDLEVAAGMYLYHVKAERTGAEKVGKFAIIK